MPSKKQWCQVACAVSTARSAACTYQHPATSAFRFAFLNANRKADVAAKGPVKVRALFGRSQKIMRYIVLEVFGMVD